MSNWTCVDDMKLLEKHGFVIVEGKRKSTVYKASEPDNLSSYGGFRLKSYLAYPG